MADLNKLVEKIKADADLKKQFTQAVKENKVVEFCKNNGFEITAEDISKNCKSSKKLTDEELNKVSGGLVNFAEHFGISCELCGELIRESQMYEHFKNDHNLTDEEMPLHYLPPEIQIKIMMQKLLSHD